MRRTIALVALISTAAMLLGACSAIEESLAEAEAAKELEATTPEDLSRIEDGSYTGSYEAGFVSVRLQAQVRDGVIRNITIEEHDNWRGGDAEKLIDQVLAEQSLEIDAVSGATVSSKVILRSLELALAGAPRRQ